MHGRLLLILEVFNGKTLKNTNKLNSLKYSSQQIASSIQTFDHVQIQTRKGCYYRFLLTRRVLGIYLPIHHHWRLHLQQLLLKLSLPTSTTMLVLLVLSVRDQLWGLYPFPVNMIRNRMPHFMHWMPLHWLATVLH
jgi:hypothetical protein